MRSADVLVVLFTHLVYREVVKDLDRAVDGGYSWAAGGGLADVATTELRVVGGGDDVFPCRDRGSLESEKEERYDEGEGIHCDWYFDWNVNRNETTLEAIYHPNNLLKLNLSHHRNI